MNRNDFIRIIRDSGQVDRQMTGEVRELLDIFPWFQSAHMLLLKGLHNAEDVKFENQLKQSAFYIADREKLYYLLQQKPATQKDVPDVSDNTLIQVKEETVLETADPQQVVIETGKNSQEIITELERKSFLADHTKETGSPSDHIPSETIVIAAESANDESASVVLMIDTDEEHFEETVYYMDPTIPAFEETDLLELDEGEIDISGHSPEPEVVTEKSESKKQLQAELIEKFILLNPRIEPVRDKTDKPQVDISKPYVEEKEGFVTETLAKIYIRQGYYSRAIDIYEKLSLKFPEKSSYFATQIEKVKGLIK